MGMSIKTNVGKISISSLSMLPNRNNNPWPPPKSGSIPPYSVQFPQNMPIAGSGINTKELNWDGKTDIVFENGAIIRPSIRSGKITAITFIAPNGKELFSGSSANWYEKFPSYDSITPTPDDPYSKQIYQWQLVSNNGYLAFVLCTNTQFLGSDRKQVWLNLATVEAANVVDGEYFFDLFFKGAKVENTGPDSDEGGGDGDFNLGQSTNIPLPDLPKLSAVDAGFISLYNPSLGQMHALYDYLWSDLFDVATFKKLFNDPMQAIIGMSIVPFRPVTAGSKNVMFGNVDTGIAMPAIGSQYQKFDCGSITVKNFHGSALDYSPFTKISIYLPYIGIRELNADEVMGRTIQVVYYMDCLSGGCVAVIKIGGSVLYQFSGQMATQIPLNSQDMSGILRNTLSAAVSLGVTAATGGVAAPMALETVANAALNSKPSISHSGSLSGCSGLLSVQTPYIIWETPRQSRAKEYNRFVGYPCNMTLNLGSLSGFTQIETAVLDTLPCTEGEKEEIDKLLKEGVLL